MSTYKNLFVFCLIAFAFVYADDEERDKRAFSSYGGYGYGPLAYSPYPGYPYGPNLPPPPPGIPPYFGPAPFPYYGGYGFGGYAGYAMAAIPPYPPYMPDAVSFSRQN